MVLAIGVGMDNTTLRTLHTQARAAGDHELACIIVNALAGSADALAILERNGTFMHPTPMPRFSPVIVPEP